MPPVVDHVLVSVPVGLLPVTLARVTVDGVTYLLVQQLKDSGAAHPTEVDKLAGQCIDADRETLRLLVASGDLQRNTTRAKLGESGCARLVS